MLEERNWLKVSLNVLVSVCGALHHSQIHGKFYGNLSCGDHMKK